MRIRKIIPSCFFIRYVLLCCQPSSLAAASSILSTTDSMNRTFQSDNIISSSSIGANITNATIRSNERMQRRLLDAPAIFENVNRDPIRILYTVTTLSEYDKGTRSTTRVSYIQKHSSYSCLLLCTWQGTFEGQYFFAFVLT